MQGINILAYNYKCLVVYSALRQVFIVDTLTIISL
jgi:hypothetical protein